MTMKPDLGGPALSDAQFQKLSKIVHRDSGIVLTKAKRGLLLARLNRRLRDLNLNDYGEYCNRLDGEFAAEERKQLLSAITTNVTAFFREDYHFKAFAALLPSLAKENSKLRIWSAACSSGQEAYSIAMTVLEMLPNISNHEIRIYATDIDPVMIEHAKAGAFSARDVGAIPQRQLKRHFERVGNFYVAKPELRRLLHFEELNLHEKWPFKDPFDVVFCRNVVIYFDTSSRQILWQRFSKAIKPCGYLFIGHSERLDGPAAYDFLLKGSTQYQRHPHVSPDNKSGRKIICR